MIRRLRELFIEYIYWRLIPFFSKLHFELEIKRLAAYLAAGELGRNSGEITKTELRTILGSVSNILEIGANDGRDTLELALTFPNAQIHAVECDVRLIGLFHQRMHRFKRVHLYAFAAWDTERFIKFYSSSGTSMGSSSLLKPKLIKDLEPGISFDSDIPVLAAPVSKLIESIALNEIDLVWMDVQGAEFTILKDLQPFLMRIKSIYLEVEHQEKYEGEALYSEILEFFSSNDFAPRREMNDGSQVVNALFTNNRFSNIG